MSRIRRRRGTGWRRARRSSGWPGSGRRAAPGPARWAATGRRPCAGRTQIGWRTAPDRAHHLYRPDRANLIRRTRTSPGGRSEDERGFFRMSRPFRSRSFSRRDRAFSETRSDGDGAGACVLERHAAPVACAPNCIIHRRSTVSCRPSSRAGGATKLGHRPPTR